MLYPFFGKNTIINQPSNNNIFTLDEIKQYLNIPTISTAKDNELTMLLNMAVEEFCDISQGSILNTTYKSQLYGFHNFDKNYNNYFYTNNVIRIKRQFIHTVNSIKYLIFFSQFSHHFRDFVFFVLLLLFLYVNVCLYSFLWNLFSCFLFHVDLQFSQHCLQYHK